MDKQAQLQAKLDELRNHFMTQLPGRFEEIKAAWESLLSNWDAETLAVLHRQVHSLTGTAGTFGLMDLSKHARTAEQQLKALVGEERVPDEPEQNLIGAMLHKLESFVPRDDDEESGPEQQESTPRALLLPEGEAHRVLLLSSDQAMIEELSAQLGYFGYELDLADDMEQFVERANAGQVAALIIDVDLKGGQFKDRYALLSLQQGRSRIPVIFLADSGTLAERVEAVRAGGDAYLLKPLDVALLVDNLDRLTGTQEMDPYRVLVVEDDPDLAERYSLVLESAGMQVVKVIRALEIMSALVELQPDLILMDIYMPDCNGLELARVIRQQDAYVSLPIVYLSSETDIDKQYEAMSLGGDDFLTKPIQDDRLVQAVRNRAARSRLLHSLMARDSLTGLLKHTKIKEALDVEISRARRQGAPVAFVMLDIDHFKRVNDTYGHLAGDRVIKSLGHLLRQRLRKSDIIGRYGGEEFAVIMPDTTEEEALRVIDGVRIAFSMIRHHWHEEQISCTFSAGIACFPANTEVDGITAVADEALYAAKGAGRNKVVGEGDLQQRKAGSK